MAHFARVVDGTVVEVVPIANEALVDGNNDPLEYPDSEPVGQAFLADLYGEPDGDWLQCSYNGSFRGLYPGEGYTFDAGLDVFVSPPLPELPPGTPSPPPA